MREERIELSERERDRLRMLHEVEQGHTKQVEAAQRLRLTDRQVRRLLVCLRREGDRGLVHGLRQRPSNRKIPDAVQQRGIRQLQKPCYAGFGPTLAAEHLARNGLSVSRETLRQWMSRARLWQPRRQRVKPVHVWRPRRAAFGELVMMDSSPFRWLDDRGPASHLIATIDDATSRVWGRLVPHDSTEENLRTLGSWLERHGRPRALYTDKNSLFVTSRPAQWQEQLRDEPARTPFGRALAELDIEWIAAQSPQAEGLSMLHTAPPGYAVCRATLPSPSRSAYLPCATDQRLSFSRAQSTLVQYGCDLQICVVIEEPIDFLHQGGVGCSLLPRIKRSGHHQGLGSPALETNV
jgi:hypothetical protein